MPVHAAVSAMQPPLQLYARAVAAYRQGNSRAALVVLQQLLRQHPGHADAWNLAGVIHGTRQEPALAADCYRRAIAAGAGKKLEIVEMDVERLLPALADGQVDFAMATFPLDGEGRELVDFSAPYYDASPVAVILAG